MVTTDICFALIRSHFLFLTWDRSFRYFLFRRKKILKTHFSSEGSSGRISAESMFCLLNVYVGTADTGIPCHIKHIEFIKHEKSIRVWPNKNKCPLEITNCSSGILDTFFRMKFSVWNIFPVENYTTISSFRLVFYLIEYAFKAELATALKSPKYTYFNIYLKKLSITKNYKFLQFLNKKCKI